MRCLNNILHDQLAITKHRKTCEVVPRVKMKLQILCKIRCFKYMLHNQLAVMAKIIDIISDSRIHLVLCTNFN